MLSYNKFFTGPNIYVINDNFSQYVYKYNHPQAKKTAVKNCAE